MKRKKLLVLPLIAAMALGTVACGSESSTANTAAETETQSETAQEQPAAETQPAADEQTSSEGGEG